MSQELLGHLARLKDDLPKLLEHLSSSGSDGRSSNSQLVQELTGLFRESLDEFPKLEKGVADLLAENQEAKVSFDQARERLEDLMAKAAEGEEAKAALARPDLADLVGRRGRLKEELAALDEAGVLWWAIVSLACLHEAGSVELERHDRVTLSLAALWVASPGQTHPRAVSPELVKRLEPGSVRALFPALAMTGLEIPLSLDSSPLSLTMRLITRFFDEANGTDVLPQYDRAIGLAQGVRHGKVGWSERSGESKEHEGFSVWLDADALDKRVDQMPEVALRRDQAFAIDRWPLEKVDELLHQCFTDLATIEQESEDPIDMIAIQFLRQPSKAVLPPSAPEESPLVQDWAMGASSVAFASLDLPHPETFESITTNTSISSVGVPGEDSFVSHTGQDEQPADEERASSRDAIHDWTWLLSSEAHVKPPEPGPSGEGGDA